MANIQSVKNKKNIFFQKKEKLKKYNRKMKIKKNDNKLAKCKIMKISSIKKKL